MCAYKTDLEQSKTFSVSMIYVGYMCIVKLWYLRLAQGIVGSGFYSTIHLVAPSTFKQIPTYTPVYSNEPLIFHHPNYSPVQDKYNLFNNSEINWSKKPLHYEYKIHDRLKSRYMRFQNCILHRKYYLSRKYSALNIYCTHGPSVQHYVQKHHIGMYLNCI